MQLVNGRLQLEDNKSVFRDYLLIHEVIQSSSEGCLDQRDSEERTLSDCFAFVKMLEGS